jgi:hypothetical protein
MFEYDENAKLASEELDNYDFTGILSLCYDNGLREPWDIRCRIEDEYTELEDALDNLSNDEFMEYLSKRYNVEFKEIITYSMWYR